MTSQPVYDVVVVGGGPAGLATAIRAGNGGLTVALIDRGASAPRPGESLHPGVAPILSRLGIDVDALGFRRFPGIRDVRQDRIVAFGQDASGPWLGYQALPKTLDGALAARALAAGVQVVRSAVISAALDGKLWSVELEDGRVVDAHWLVDATGTRGLGDCAWTRVSPRLFASWVLWSQPHATVEDEMPTFRSHPQGWTYRACISESLVSEVEVALHGERPHRPTRPHQLYRGFDVTWRHRFDVSRKRSLRVGDAQFVVDPAAGKGVLRALMSGMMAAHSILAERREGARASLVEEHYREWSRRLFKSECEGLGSLYAQPPFALSWARDFAGARVNELGSSGSGIDDLLPL